MKQIIIRQDISSKELRAAAKKEKNAKASRRLLAMAGLVDGGTRAAAQTIACLSHNVFRVWLQRFNAQGIQGIFSKKPTGRPAKIPPDVLQKLKEKILKGPAKEEGLVRYRIVDFQKYLQSEHQISKSQSGIWQTLQDLNLSWKTGRQRHPKSDEAKQEAFKKTLQKR